MSGKQIAVIVLLFIGYLISIVSTVSVALNLDKQNKFLIRSECAWEDYENDVENPTFPTIAECK